MFNIRKFLNMEQVFTVEQLKTANKKVIEKYTKLGVSEDKIEIAKHTLRDFKCELGVNKNR